ncbi:rho guanine nucleotide exchange factor 26 isoform X2 [Rhinatrema bivittatum]|uniref:rho guanine nucleotide exchange factor 26 isoform X2 n=1 Tax=Rhinatrema bivittatum TaxID=194408 RepID=UPI001127C8B6|nr:rho guanine nucleotide exchange factor 26 isoform X2 [Rhinatrema bivittatum]
MESESEVDFTHRNHIRIAPLWKRKSTPPPAPRLGEKPGHCLGTPRPRPQSYQSPSGVLVTDFPLEDRCTFTVSQPAEKVGPFPESVSPAYPGSSLRPMPNGKPAPASQAGWPKRIHRSPPLLKVACNSSISFAAGGTPPDRNAAPAALASEPGALSSGSGFCCNGGGEEEARSADNCSSFSPVSWGPPDLSPPSSSPSSPEHRAPLQRLPSDPEQLAQNQSIVLSTNSPVALKVGKQQIIPVGLASGVKITSRVHQPSSFSAESKRGLKARSLTEPGAFPVAARVKGEGDPEPELDSPGTLRRGLRSTSYRRAVVSGVDFDASSNAKKSNRMSQPILKAVVEDKEKFSSLVRIKRKMMRGQGTFDGEAAAVLYQNYKEKALEIESDEDTDPKEQKLPDRIVVQHKPLRSTWSQLSMVKKNGLFSTVNQEERKRQEAIFEVISSERSYLLSLEILIRMFKNSKPLSSTMTKTESHHLFSNISDVYEASNKFFKELEARHQKTILIDDISDIVEKHAMATFDPYVKYCSNEVYQQRTLQKLISTNASFKEVLSGIESNEDCRSLPMISFLILPMQRVTRLPLLMDTICQKTPKDSSKYEACKRALKELVRLCNEGARTMERTEMMYTINSQLEFKIKPFPLVSSSRWLVKRGELTAYVEDSGIFSKRTSKQQVYFFLFNDVLIITKKKSEDSYNVTDYALRDQLSVEQCDNEELNSSPGKNSSAVLYLRQSSTSHLFMLSIHSNHAGEEVEMLLGAETLSERARWIAALGQSTDKQSVDRATLTQVEIIRSYTAKQPEELSLQAADVVLLYQKVNDGWYEGERLRDGERGWFPMECAKEITCRATIDKNMERMGRLLGLETNV